MGIIGGCTTVRPLMSPAPFISAKHPNIVYALDKEGRVYVIARPVVQGDSVVGVSPRLDRSVGLPMSSVSRVSAAQVSTGRTVLLVGLLGASAAGLVYFASHSGSSSGCAEPEPPYSYACGM